jgi:hypothetical protein
VLWIGTGAAPGGITADLFACEACVHMLGDQILGSVMSRDIGGHDLSGLANVGQPAPRHPYFPEVPGGRHRRRP